MGTTLQHGIFLPAEGERNCYTGLASNWTILDGVIGGYSSHAANLTIHVTAEDKAAWNGKAEASALTAHTGNTTIHVTAEDKAKWDAVTGKANDADVVHKSGDETIGGQKVFTDTNAISNSAELGVSAGNNSFKVVDKNKKTMARLEGGTFSTGMAYSYLVVNNGTDVFNGVALYQQSANLAQLRPYSSTLSLQLGATNRSFSDCYTSKINGVEPSSLSLPSGNARDVIDISSYITDFSGTANTYTAPANGWVTISVNNCTGIQAYIAGLFGDSRARQTAGTIKFLMPIRKNQTINLQVYGGTLEHARFIPCQGNV